jgi:hypothetical protein
MPIFVLITFISMDFPVAIIASFWRKVKKGNIIYGAPHFWAFVKFTIAN